MTGIAVIGRAVAMPASWLYGLGAVVHRRVMRAVAARRRRPACAIVSVGAITVGGAGKTPVAAHLAAALARRGHRVVLASRGYGGTAREPVTLVSDGAQLHARAAEAGDEPLVLAAHAPGVPVLVGRDRNVVGRHAVLALGCEILVLDDGFQHHRVPRDLDLVCLDAVAGLGNGRVLPAGPLRERAGSLAFADWLCVVDGGTTVSPAVRDWSERLAGAGRLVLRAHRRPSGLTSLDGRRRDALSDLAGRRVGLICGIARPDSFVRTVEALGATVASVRRFPDHHAYCAQDLAALDPGIALWLTTEKDAVKLVPDWVSGADVRVLSIEIEIEHEEAVLARLEEQLRASGRLGPARVSRASLGRASS